LATREATREATKEATKEELNRSMQIAHYRNNNTDLYFATYEPTNLDPENSFYEFGPSIIIIDHKTPTKFITWPEFFKYGWVFTAQLPSKGYYWGFLDYQVAGPGHEIIVLWSKDSGLSWGELSPIKKNSYLDEFYTFSMDEFGLGSAIVKRFDEGSNGSAGFDVFKTNDYGQNWSTPVFLKSVLNFIDTSKANCTFSMRATKLIPPECAIPLDSK
jgi:hypothetical protein